MIGHFPGKKFKGVRPPQLFILLIVRNEKKYGYEILKELRDVFDGAWEPKTGFIYPLIRRMRDDGLLVSEIVDDREYYGLSDDGRELLLEMLPHFGHVVFMATKVAAVVSKAMEDLDVEMAEFKDPLDTTDEEKLAHLKEMRDHMENELAKINEKINEIEGRQ
jgi:Predicted transcriptional regulators